jgi:threonylcarbamoyladenosine tRNA methylthiotransferase MtaB
LLNNPKLSPCLTTFFLCNTYGCPVLGKTVYIIVNMGKNMPSVYVKTLGCKVNTFDGNVLENQFLDHGYDRSGDGQAADVTVINTCSVTANADKEARYLARRIRRDNPDTLIVFTGCYAQTDSAALAAMDEIDLVVPNEVKDQLYKFVSQGIEARGRGQVLAKMPEGVSEVSENRQSHFKSSVTLFDRADSSQTRAFVKIQDGCNGFCTYCLIPYARGASRSVQPNLILEEVKRLVSLGTEEVVLTGIHIGDYGEDLDTYSSMAERPIADLIRKIFDTTGLKRLRISSLEPAELSDDLLKVLSAYKGAVCDHLHLPLQSGSNRILKLMRRTYDRERYAQSVRQFRELFPNAGIGADVIPGFPSESDDDFNETVNLIKELELSYLHVFPYSRRPNTAAFRMPGHLDVGLIKERSKTLRNLSTAMSQSFATKFIGTTHEVLWEKDLDKLGRRTGYTRNYLSIALAQQYQAEPGSLTNVRLKGFVEQGRLLGIPVH